MLRGGILKWTSGTLERMLFKLNESSNRFRNPNVTPEDLLKINNSYFDSDKRVEKAILFTRNFYVNKLRDDGKSSFFNQHLGYVAKNTLVYAVNNYEFDIDSLKNTFIASLNHDFIEHFPEMAPVLKEYFGNEVYGLVSAVTIPKNVGKSTLIEIIDNITDERPKVIKANDFDNNIRSSTNIVLTLAYNLIQDRLKKDKDSYKKNMDFYDNYRPKISRYIGYSDDYSKIAKNLPGNLDKKINNNVKILKKCDSLFYNIFKENYVTSGLLRKIRIPDLYHHLERLAIKGG